MARISNRQPGKTDLHSALLDMILIHSCRCLTRRLYPEPWNLPFTDRRPEMGPVLRELLIKPGGRGDAYLCRYADDFVCLFRYKEDAERFYAALGQRMAKFGLELAEEKTKVISFSRFRKWEKTSFEFLGFEFRRGAYGKRDMIIRRTSTKKFRLGLAALTEWCKKHRHLPLKSFFRIFNAKLRGHFNYFGVFGNSKRLRTYYHEATRILFNWLNRRSQRRSKNWTGFRELLKHFQVPRPRIREQLFHQPAA